MSEVADNLDGPGMTVRLDRAHPVTVVAFGGGMGHGGQPPFEFFRFLSGLDINYVLLRDHQQAWYQLGVRGVADCLPGVGERLLALLGRDRLSRSIFAGGSLGGYAALLLGSQLGAGEAQVFATQTFISRRLRRYYRDFRFPKQVDRTRRLASRANAYFDIKAPVRRAMRNGGVELHLHVGTHRLDLCHARRMIGIPHLTVHQYDEIPSHRVAVALQNDGRLANVFAAAIARHA